MLQKKIQMIVVPVALPSYAATAWYHHKLPGQPEKLESFLQEVEHFAMNEYAQALNQGSLLLIQLPSIALRKNCTIIPGYL